MKKIFNLILLALLVSSTAFAQTSLNRTTKTKIVDAVAMMPAKNAREFDRMAKDFVSTGKEGVSILASMFNSVNNESVSYSFSAWSTYVNRPGNEAARKEFIEGICNEITKTKDNEIQRFYLKLMELSGSDEAVSTIVRFLSDKDLKRGALSALIAIDTDKSKKAIIDNKAVIDNDMMYAQAIGQAKITGQEDQLIAYLDNEDFNVRKAALYAISRTGTEKCLKPVYSLIKKNGFKYDSTNAVAAYFDLIEKIAENNESQAVKSAKSMFKAGGKTDRVNLMVAASEILLNAKSTDRIAYVVKAMDSESKIYRKAILRLAEGLNCNDIAKELLAEFDEFETPVQVDVAEYFGNIGYAPAQDQLIAILGSDQKCLNVSASKSLLNIKPANPEAVVSAIINKISATEDEEIIKLLADNLRSTPYAKEVSSLNSKLIAIAKVSKTSAAQIQAINMLAERRATESADDMIALYESNNSAVSAAACNALEKVVTFAHKDVLLKKLLAASKSDVAPLQRAIIESIRTKSSSEKLSIVKDMMSKAGSHKALLYAVLAQTGDASALTTIVDGLKSGGASDRLLAIEAMDSWEGAAVFAPLLEVIKMDDKNLSNMAANSYLKQIKKLGYKGENLRLYASNVLKYTKDDKTREKALTALSQSASFIGFMTVAEYMSSDNAKVREAACQAIIKISAANKSIDGTEVVRILNECSKKLNNPDAAYDRQAITEHLLKINKEGGFVPIFNSKDLTGWKGLVGNPVSRAKMSAKQLSAKQKFADEKMKESWSVKDGNLCFNGKGENICTVKQYGDFEMYIDWRLDPKGPEADAGIYLRGTPQVQIWDISRTNVGAQVGSGGLYNNKKHASAPTSVADNPLGEWNNFYIKMVGERVTVVLNGIKVVDNVIMENYWDKTMPVFLKEQIELQAHGSKVEYRNIYVRELKAAEPAKLSDQEKKEGFKLLFDGLTMNGWKGNTQDYVAENGNIVLYPKNGGGGNLYTEEEFSDFILRFDFWLTPGANNGLGIRTPDKGDAAYVGIELQILDNEAPVYKNLEKYQYHGSVYGVIPAKRGYLKEPGEWNTEEVIAKGHRITVKVNGTVIVDGDIAEASKNNTATMDHRKHPGLLNESGHIGFLGHGSHVQFRNIRIKPLK